MSDQPLLPLYRKTLEWERRFQAAIATVGDLAGTALVPRAHDLAASRAAAADDLDAVQGLIGLLLQLDPTLDPERADAEAKLAEAEGVEGWQAGTPDGPAPSPTAEGALFGALARFNRHTSVGPSGPTAPPPA